MKRNYTTEQLSSMCDNLFWKLRGWMLREGNKRCITAGEIFDKVIDHAPQTIKKSGVLVRILVVRLWAVDRDYSLESCELASADLNDCMIDYYGGC